MARIACICPPKTNGEPRHEHDTVTLRPRLDFRAATTVRNAIGLLYAEEPDCSVAEILATLTEHYILSGIESWSLVDKLGKPVPVTKPAIRELLLMDQEAATIVGEEADSFYAEAVMLPLLNKASKSSPGTATEPSTSPANGSSPTLPSKPSKPSSTTTTPTDGTETTSPSLVGASSS